MTTVVLLAAGGGARYRASGGPGHKLLASFRGRPVVEWALAHAVEADVGPVHVVVGAVDLPVPAGVTVIRNPDWASGLASSLQLAVGVARRAGDDSVLVGLGDQPLVEAEAWRLVHAAPAAPLAVATYSGQRGHPVRLGSDVWPLLPTAGDEGARSVLRDHGDLVVEVPCPGSPLDVDTREDLSRWS
ncbi:MAG TPA: nucleotidyltransferase family protein [Acidimicrobiales bacterium]|jgi:CTP:molybdopterin cytidylyltransferase MocA